MIQVKRFSHATFETPDLERQIDYFTQVVGLAVAVRENGRAHLATKVGDLVVQLEKSDQARCTRLSFQVDPDTEFGDIRRGLEAGGCAVSRGTIRPRESPRRSRSTIRKAPGSTCSPNRP